MLDHFYNAGDRDCRAMRQAGCRLPQRRACARDCIRQSVFAIALIACCRFACASPPSTGSTLYLYDGDFFAGHLEDCATPDIVRWQSQGATEPFEFPAGAFRAAYFPTPPASPAPEGDYCFELFGGDILYGSLVGVTPQQFAIKTAHFGQLHLDRSQVSRIAVVGDSSKGEYRGPNGLAEWHPSAENLWTEEAGRLITATRHAEVQKELTIPDLARIEFEIAWSADPNFALVFSAGPSAEDLQAGYRFEVWDHKLVLVRAGKTNADVAYIYTLNTGADRIHLEAFYEQKTGKLSVHSLDGKQLAEITLLERDGTPLQVVSLTNQGQGVRLERLAITRWSGRPPAEVDADKTGVQLTDGTIIYGDLVGYQSESKQFVVQTDSEEKHVDAAQLACIAFTPDAPPVAGSFQVGFHDGNRVQGGLTKVEEGKLYVTRHGIEEPLVCAIGEVRSLVGLESNYQRPAIRDRGGRLDLDGVHSHGALVAAAANRSGTTDCLIWQPQCSTTSSPLDQNVSGRIVYRDPPQPPPKLTRREQELQRLQRQNRPQPPAGVFGAIARVLSGDQTSDQAAPPKPQGGARLYLLAGDRIPCEVSEIDEEGIHFKSPVVASTFVPNSGAKAVEFVPNWTAAALDDVKRQRLLTLPRMQKGNPPTHLVVSTTGDYLRTRLTAMSKDTLTCESHLEAKQISRDRVACLIWLHDASDPAPSNSPGDSPTAAAEASTAPRIQAIQSDGVRLTFAPQECDGKQLSGTSTFLGACRIDLNRVDALVLGNAIGSEAAEQEFQLWKLTDAVEPRYLRDSATGSASDRPAAAGSDIVGKKVAGCSLGAIGGGPIQSRRTKRPRRRPRFLGQLVRSLHASHAPGRRRR